MKIDAVVIGRISADLVPTETHTPLERVSGFSRAVGGFGGNVAVALARLRIPVALLACVGDDGHGRYVSQALAGEGVNVEGVRAVPNVRTPLAFMELWPPDRFPITFYPTAAYWALEEADVVEATIAAAPALVVSGTSLAHEPSRSATSRALAIHHTARSTGTAAQRTVLDIDWRPALWSDARTYRERVAGALPFADVVVGGAEEFGAADVDPAALARTTPIVIVKRGRAGVTVIEGERAVDIPAHRVETVNGLGAGDGFVAAFVAALLRGLGAARAGARGNAAGAIVASRLSTSWAMPTDEEIDALMARTAAIA